MTSSAPDGVFMVSKLNESYLPHYRLRSVLNLARTVVETQPLDVAAATLLVARIRSLAGPRVERPAREAAVALEAARAKPKARHGGHGLLCSNGSRQRGGGHHSAPAALNRWLAFPQSPNPRVHHLRHGLYAPAVTAIGSSRWTDANWTTKSQPSLLDDRVFPAPVANCVKGSSAKPTEFAASRPGAPNILSLQAMPGHANTSPAPRGDAGPRRRFAPPTQSPHSQPASGKHASRWARSRMRAIMS